MYHTVLISLCERITDGPDEMFVPVPVWSLYSLLIITNVLATLWILLSNAYSHFMFVLGQNLGRVSAIMVVMGHVLKNDLSMAKTNSRTSLLCPPGDSFIIAGTDEILDLEGAYLYYDIDDSCWIRSGKVIGNDRSFGKRNKEHAKKALELTMDSLKSLFYQTYPSKNAPSNGCMRNGYFENL